jgi:hypothetical protein
VGLGSRPKWGGGKPTLRKKAQHAGRWSLGGSEITAGHRPRVTYDSGDHPRSREYLQETAGYDWLGLSLMGGSGFTVVTIERWENLVNEG